jgi:hypothetical protein
MLHDTPPCFVQLISITVRTNNGPLRHCHPVARRMLRIAAIQDHVYALAHCNNSNSTMSTCIKWIRIQHPGALHMERMNPVVAPSSLY